MKKVEIGLLHVHAHADGKRVELVTPEKLDVGDHIHMHVKGEDYEAHVLEYLGKAGSADHRYLLGS